MFVVGRLIGRVDSRWIIAAGFLLTAVSLHQMTGFYLQMGTASVVLSGLLQGLGTGFVYVPLAAISFATLAPSLRNEGTALFSLVRNLGSSIGISAVTTLLTRNSQILHSRLAEHVTPYGHAAGSAMARALSSAAGLAGLDASVTRQATMLAYNNDFQLMMVLTLCAVPLVALLRRAGAPQKSDEPVVME
jgi:DHA2 family multidrug resistance protein